MTDEPLRLLREIRAILNQLRPISRFGGQAVSMFDYIAEPAAQPLDQAH